MPECHRCGDVPFNGGRCPECSAFIRERTEQELQEMANWMERDILFQESINFQRNAGAAMETPCQCCGEHEAVARMTLTPSLRCLVCIDEDPALPPGDVYLAEISGRWAPTAARQLVQARGVQHAI